MSTRQARRAEARQHARRDQHKTTTRAGGRISRTWLIIASIVAVAVVAAIIWAGSGATTGPQTTVPPGITQSGHVRGQASAPVTIDEYADFQCPACGLFARTTETQILSSYVAKGQVKIVFHNFAFLGMESNWAAEAADCAGEQGKFFDYHDRLYASQAGENQGAFSRDNLKKLGNDLGLGSTFAACVDSGKYAQSVRDETAAGDAAGVNATPTFFIGGKKYTGVLSFDQMKQIIDPLLVGR
ncbi:MAG TPA: DsbA family protein [Candidatus Limnocylindria bacterium]